MRTAETNPVFQSKILPIIQKAETEIKTLILVAFLYAQPKTMLLGSILAVINRVKKELPIEFKDRDQYVKGLVASADRMVIEGYNKPQVAYNLARQTLKATSPSPINITTPKQVFDLTRNYKDLWAEAKGSPNVIEYPKRLKETIRRLSDMPTTTAEIGKKPISLWQKAELDTRLEGQFDMLDKLRENGVDMAYISTHPNCSKRCQCWQGRLVSLNERAAAPRYDNSGNTIKYDTKTFIVGNVEGRNVYSLPDIMDCVDKYGYNNNVIVGFNCRHRLIPYKVGELPPKRYDNSDITKQREIEGKIREMERKIRLLKTNERMYNVSGDKLTAATYKRVWQKLESHYKRFCERNGYAWQEYRIKI